MSMAEEFPGIRDGWEPGKATADSDSLASEIHDVIHKQTPGKFDIANLAVEIDYAEAFPRPSVDPGNPSIIVPATIKIDFADDSVYQTDRWLELIHQSDFKSVVTSKYTDPNYVRSLAVGFVWDENRF